MSYRSLPIGNLSNTNITFGSGIQSDASFSYVTVNCDPKVVLPRTSVTDPVNPSRSNPKRYEGNLDIAGKIAVERDICNLEVANLKVTGTLILTGPAVFKSCVVIEEDGAVCCPLTVRNTSASDPQAGNALCVEGSTVMIPLTDPATAATGQALLFLDGTQADVVLTNDYMLIDARALSSGIGIDINLDSDNTDDLRMRGKGINVLKNGSSLENSTLTAVAPGGRLLYINAPTERGQNYDVGVTPNVGDAIALSEIVGPFLTDVSEEAGGPLNPPGLNSVRQSALYINCIPDVSTGRINPVGALYIEGGTIFSGHSTSTNDLSIAPGNGQGHLHSRQVGEDGTPLPPALVPQTFDGNNATGGVGEPMFVFYGQLDSTQGGGVGPQVPPVGGPPREPGNATDVSGIIGFQSQGGNLSRITVNFAVPYPEGTVPVVQLTPGLNLAAGIALSTGANTEAQILAVGGGAALGTASLPANKGFTVYLQYRNTTPTTAGIITNGVNWYFHYKVMAVIE